MTSLRSTSSMRLLSALLLCCALPVGCGSDGETTDGGAGGSPAGQAGAAGSTAGKGGAGGAKAGASGSAGAAGSVSGASGQSGQAGAGTSGASGQGGAGAGGAGAAGAGAGGAGAGAAGAGAGGDAGVGGAGGAAAGAGGTGGVSGEAGASGQAASSGSSGQSGSAGSAGSAAQGGEAGAGGESGASGQSGEAGAAGQAGAAGEAGQSGAGGVAGGAGQSGAGGFSGSSGQSGAAGSSGCEQLGQTACPTGCADLASDPENCGDCGQPCGAQEACQAGVCVSTDPCVPDPCNGHGSCAAGVCSCNAPFAGAACDQCGNGFSNYPDCSCQTDNDCKKTPSKPYCDANSGACVACLSDESVPPPGLCQGVCSLVAPSCIDNAWQCTGPGYEAVEESCDGFDNDCDGQIDEGCPPCQVAIDKVKQNLGSIWDIDFDFACNTYLTSLVSGPDFARVISYDATKPVTTFFGNANQNMGFGLVDPDPNKRRVVVSYACGNNSCQAQNGMTLLYTCAASDPGCGCAAQANCPGFLNKPFLPGVAPTKTALTFNGFEVGVPTGLAVATGSRYFVGNYKPLTCDASPSCKPCDPDHLTVRCEAGESCCDSSPFGRLVEFTLPEPGKPPSFRVARIIEGEQIFGLSGGRDGSVWVGTYVSPTKGNLYRYDPFYNILTLIASYDGPVFSITQKRQTGEWYIEVRATPKLVRLGEFGAPLALPATVPASPAQDGVLQAGPDGKLYRVIGKVDTTSSLEVYDLP